MALAHSKFQDNGKRKSKIPIKRMVDSPFTLERPAKKELKKDDYTIFKLKTNPQDPNSATYEFHFPYFKDGDAEEYLTFLVNLRKTIVGQGINQGPNKYALARAVLQGDALAAFNRFALQHGNETNQNFTAAVNSLTEHVIPQRALPKAKRWMRRFLRKPREWKIRAFVNRLAEVNELLTLLPPFGNDQKLADDEIMDILEFAVPATWQKLMILHGFDPWTATRNDFIAFCERIESTELEPEGTKSKTDQNGGNETKSSAKSSERGKTTIKHDGSKKGSHEKYCSYHKAYGHDMNECKVMLDQANKMRGAWEASKNKTWRRSDNKSNNDKKFNQHELNALIDEKVQEALQKQNKGKRKKEKEEENYNIQEFAALEVEDSSDDETPSDEE